MKNRWLVPALAALGAVITIAALIIDAPSPAKAAAPAVPRSPWASHIAAMGIVEPQSGSIAIGAPNNGIVATVPVAPGQAVMAGDVLFKIDDSDVVARLPSVTARARELEVAIARARYQLKVGDSLRTDGVIGDAELQKRRFDVDSADAALNVAHAELAQLKAEIDRRVVHSPISGRVLAVHARSGEQVGAGSGGPLVVVGDDSVLLVRVEIDELDAARFDEKGRARAFLRGDATRGADVAFVREEPLLVPKGALSGDSAERTDARVLQVLYRLAPSALAVHVGQQLEVFIEVPRVDPKSAR